MHLHPPFETQAKAPKDSPLQKWNGVNEDCLEKNSLVVSITEIKHIRNVWANGNGLCRDSVVLC